MFEAILQQIQQYHTIILHRHTRPDGDALGSQLGLKWLLLENYPEKEVWAVGDDAGFFSFMEGAAMDEIPDSAYSGALAIILDCGSPALISDDRYTLAADTARLDHHIFSGSIARQEVVDTGFESCCGLVTQMAIEAGWQLTLSAAQALYTGMVTDSGRFRYDGTTARTFRLAAWLMEQPIDTNQLFRNLYADDYENKKRKAQFILKVKFTPHRVAYIYTTKAEVEEMGISVFTASRGMVNTMADIRGSDIWANFTETDDGILCELRSGSRSINHIAVKYGGGGHAKACGATVPDYATAMEMLSDLDRLIGGTT